MKRHLTIDPKTVGEGIQLTDFRLLDGRTLRVASWITDENKVTLRQAASEITRALLQKAWESGKEKPDETELET